MKQVLIISVRYDDEKFAQRPQDLLHAALTGIREQYGPQDSSGIAVVAQYDSTRDVNWPGTIAQ